MASERIELYVWKPAEGGWSRQWRWPKSLLPEAYAFFWFGRFCGGWAPFDSSKMGTREETQLAAERAFEKFGLPVDVYYGQAPPPEEE